MAIPGLRKAVLGLLAGGAATATMTEDAEAIPLGPTARTFDHGLARGARRMLAEGPGRGESIDNLFGRIWREKRTRFDRYGTPMQESPTDTIRWRPEGLERMRAGHTIAAGSAIEYPEAFAAYPELADMSMRVVPREALDGASMSAFGKRNPRARNRSAMIALGDQTLDDRRGLPEMLAHEYTHLGPQYREKRPIGGTLEDAAMHHRDEVYAERARRIEQMRRAIRDMQLLTEMGGGRMAEENLDFARRALQSAEANPNPNMTDFENVYRRFDGEDEAFAAQARYSMSPAERARRSPARQTRVPQDRLIYNGGVPGYPVGSPPPLMSINALRTRP